MYIYYIHIYTTQIKWLACSWFHTHDSKTINCFPFLQTIVMRVRLAASVVVVLLVVLLGCVNEATAQFTNRRAALRARARLEAADRLRRGFQNSALATARGFGKRSDPDMKGVETLTSLSLPSSAMNHMKIGVFPSLQGITSDISTDKIGDEDFSLDDRSIKDNVHQVAKLIKNSRSEKSAIPWVSDRGIFLEEKRLLQRPNSVVNDER